MKLSRLATSFCLAIYILALSACGDYVPQPYEGFPYMNERTAGHGVAYVREKMAPMKDVVIPEPEPVAETTAPTEDKTMDVKSAEELFKSYQQKTRSFKLEMLREKHYEEPRYNQ